MEVTGLDDSQICQHGKQHVDNPMAAAPRHNIGYVKFLHSSITKLKLVALYDNNPPRHVSIEFPDDPGERREKGKLLELECLEISKNSDKPYFLPCPSD